MGETAIPFDMEAVVNMSAREIPGASARRAMSPWKALLKWTLFAVVLIFVVRYGYQQWQQMDFSAIRWSPAWLLLALVLYFVAWIPSAWVWWWLMRAAGQSVRFYPALRAHFCGHLGKYAPGKALALIIRTAMIRGPGISGAFAVLLGTVETLIVMATGLLVLVVLLPLVLAWGDGTELTRLLPLLGHLQELPVTIQLGITGGLLLLALLSAPLAALLLTRLVRRISRRYNIPMNGQASESDPGKLTVKVTSRTMLVCGTAGGVVWLLNGLCLGCVLAGMNLPPVSMLDPLLWICAVAGATSLGFVVLFAPGGLGVREAVLVALLQISPAIDPAHAVLAAVLLRLVSLLSEVMFAGILYALPEAPGRKASLDREER